MRTLDEELARTSTFDSWIACRKPNAMARIRLFCFAHAGGAASTFRTWSDSLPIDIEVCPIQLPGRGARLVEPPFSDFRPLVEALAEALVPLLDRPFAFFGHSLGSLVGFELARRLRSHHQKRPVRLFVSAAPAPQIPHRDRSISKLPEKEFLSELRRLNGTPRELLNHRELMDIAFPLLRADFALYESYRYSSELPLECPISVYGGLDDQTVKYRDLQRWRDQTSASSSIRVFPGDHFFLRTTEPLLLRTLAKELR
jgi:medium-chain acyl-[acyl-carrier-protein] hydrolase